MIEECPKLNLNCKLRSFSANVYLYLSSLNMTQLMLCMWKLSSTMANMPAEFGNEGAQ